MEPYPFIELLLGEFWTQDESDAIEHIVKTVRKIVDDDQTGISLFDYVNNCVRSYEAKSSRNQHVLYLTHPVETQINKYIFLIQQWKLL